MKGYTIQHSIDLLEKAVEDGGGSGGASTAADVSYDNTTSHMTADDVQEAIDELNGNIETVSGAVTTLTGRVNVYPTTETLIGSYMGEPLYRKLIEVPSFTSVADTGNHYYYGSITLSDYIADVAMAFIDTDHSYMITGENERRGFIFGNYDNLTTGETTLGTLYARTAVPAVIVVDYTKVATPSETRKKKK